MFTLYRTILKTKKFYRPTMKNTKNVPANMRFGARNIFVIRRFGTGSFRFDYLHNV